MNYNYLYEPFLDSVKLLNDKIAIINDDKQISYHQLDIYSNLLAREILFISNEKTKIIAVSFDKGWEQIVSVLAILKAGFTYIPISPEYPINRISSIVDQANINIIISFGDFKSLFSQEINFLDFNNLNFNDTIEMEELKVINHEEIAYVICTSGTTVSIRPDTYC